LINLEAVEFINEIDSFRILCKRYNIPDDDLEEIYETLKNENLVESIRKEQLEKHPLFGQVENEMLKLPVKTEMDFEEIESFQKQDSYFWKMKGYILDNNGKLVVNLKAIKEACSIYGTERAKVALEKITKASQLINDVISNAQYTGQLHNFTNLFTADSDGQIIPNLKFIRGL